QRPGSDSTRYAAPVRLASTASLHSLGIVLAATIETLGQGSPRFRRKPCIPLHFVGCPYENYLERIHQFRPGQHPGRDGPGHQADHIIFHRTSLLAPADAPPHRRPYVPLLDAIKHTNTAAVGRLVRQRAEHFCLIRPKGNALALETLFLAEDVRSQAEIEEAVEEIDVKDAELELARQVIGSLAADFDPQELVSDYRRDLKALLEA